MTLRIRRPATRTENWLIRGPKEVQQGVWDVVALAAITAMKQGRRFVAATLKKGPPQVPGLALTEQAITRVVADFWSHLEGFVGVRRRVTFGSPGPKPSPGCSPWVAIRPGEAA